MDLSAAAAAIVNDSQFEMEVDSLISISLAEQSGKNSADTLTPSATSVDDNTARTTMPVNKVTDTSFQSSGELDLAILSAVRREDWIRVHEMSKQTFSLATPASIFKESLHAIAEIELGENSTTIRNNMLKIKINIEKAPLEETDAANIATGTLLYALALAETTGKCFCSDYIADVSDEKFILIQLVVPRYCPNKQQTTIFRSSILVEKGWVPYRYRGS